MSDRSEVSNGGGNPSDDLLTWLEEWYSSQCDGEWEHSWGVKIDTLDNPGWTVEIDLIGTSLEYANANFEEGLKEKSKSDWFSVKISDGKFRAACGPTNLKAALELFRRFATSI